MERPYHANSYASGWTRIPTRSRRSSTAFSCDESSSHNAHNLSLPSRAGLSSTSRYQVLADHPDGTADLSRNARRGWRAAHVRLPDPRCATSYHAPPGRASLAARRNDPARREIAITSSPRAPRWRKKAVHVAVGCGGLGSCRAAGALWCPIRLGPASPTVDDWPVPATCATVDMIRGGRAGRPVPSLARLRTQASAESTSPRREAFGATSGRRNTTARLEWVPGIGIAARLSPRACRRRGVESSSRRRVGRGKLYVVNDNGGRYWSRPRSQRRLSRAVIVDAAERSSVGVSTSPTRFGRPNRRSRACLRPISPTSSWLALLSQHSRVLLVSRPKRRRLPRRPLLRQDSFSREAAARQLDVQSRELRLGLWARPIEAHDARGWLFMPMARERRRLLAPTLAPTTASERSSSQTEDYVAELKVDEHARHCDSSCYDCLRSATETRPTTDCSTGVSPGTGSTSSATGQPPGSVDPACATPRSAGSGRRPRIRGRTYGRRRTRKRGPTASLAVLPCPPIGEQ